MIDVRKAEAQAAQWDISLRDWMELHTRVFGNVDAFGNFDIDDESDEEWRGRVSQVLIDNKLLAKAKRYMECCRYAHLYQCDGEKRHDLFSPIYCDLRFCPRCAPRQFARLIRKYEPVLKAVTARTKAGFRVREITLTTRKTGNLTPEQIKKFNRDIKKTLKCLTHGVKGWGAIWCDELGRDNTNLHAHILFYGPFISQSRLADVWNLISGHQVVYIKESHKQGGKALLYMLKYVSKPPASDPTQIGLLEVAFHGTRRVHALGIFYNFKGEDTDCVNSEWSSCPHCGAGLTKLPGSTRIEKAITDGRTFVGTKNTDRRKLWIN
jgi:ribosomal protein S27AE